MKYSVPSDLLSNFVNFIDRRLGLTYAEDHYDDLLETLFDEMAFTKDEQLSAYINKILTSTDEKDLDKLSELLTIGETFFFRNGCGLDVFQHRLLPYLIKKKSKTKSIRIWSAGCCTGEEPYSIAMIIDQMIPKREEWNITILGTDLNKQFLEKARRGVYRPWSFRNTPKNLQKLYFNKVHNKEFKLSPSIKKMVQFETLNLIEDPFPSLETGTNALDFLFCNNAMIYFSEKNIHGIVTNFRKCLLNEGYLIVTPVEAPFIKDDHLQQDEDVGIFIKSASKVQKKTVEKPTVPVNAIEPLKSKASLDLPPPPSRRSEASVKELYEAGEYEQCIDSLTNKELLQSDALILIRAYANLGLFEQAEVVCRESITKDELDPVFYFILGNILYECNQMEEASLEYKRAIFLDPNFIMAHFSLACVLLKLDQKKPAVIHKKAVLEGLKKLDPEEVLEGSESMKAKYLEELVKEMFLD